MTLRSGLILAVLNIPSFAVGEEKIIQQETMSFARCLKVIETSESKLSISPQIINESQNRRLATFTLSDGSLQIRCDGTEDTITVSTQTN